MCELLAMSARYPATVRLSLEEFSRHGGFSGPHKDGWGIAFYQGCDARVIREVLPASSSACERFIEKERIESTLVISHIRHATQGKIALENTQPFSRCLGGRRHIFAHNGDLDAALTQYDIGRYRLLGDTDSERAFCVLLSRLESMWLRDEPPSLEARQHVINDFARDMRGLGIGNFLYTDGEVLFAHGHRRHQPDGTIRPPGLHFLCRHCTVDEPSATIETQGFGLSSTSHEQRVVLVASVPLTNEGWVPFEPGEILTIMNGKVITRTEAS